MDFRSHDDARALEAMVALLEMDVGYEINFFGMLNLWQLEDLSYGVNYIPLKKVEGEWYFTSAREAATFFLQKRAERELGYDFERVPPEPSARK
jgi:hypothetical protein